MKRAQFISVLAIAVASALWSSGVIPAIIPQAVPVANKIGNSTKFQLGVSGAVAGDCPTFDGSLNITGPGTGSPCISQRQLINTVGLALTNGVTQTNWVGHAASGDVDLVTAANGKRLEVESLEIYNDSGSAVSWYGELKTGGVYYQIGAATSTNPNVNSPITIGFVLDPGETFAIHVGTASVLNIFGIFVEYDSTVGLRTAKLTSFINGDNVLYQCPANLHAVPLNPTAPWSTFSNYGYFNGSASTIAVNSFFVPNGQTSGATTRFRAQASIAPGVGLGPNTLFSMTAGDKIVVNTDHTDTGQIAYITILEF